MPITSLSQLDLNKKYTYTDYLTWQFQERVELIKGFILKMSPAPSTKHQRILNTLSISLWPYFKSSSCEYFIAPFDVRLPVPKEKKEYTVVQPDICIICDPDKIDERGCNGSPDVVVEILSPGNSKREMKIKFEVYEEAEIKEYWLVDPTSESVIIYKLNAEGKYIGLAPQTTGEHLRSPLFPELAIDLDELFQTRS